MSKYADFSSFPVFRRPVSLEKRPVFSVYIKFFAPIILQFFVPLNMCSSTSHLLIA